MSVYEIRVRYDGWSGAPGFNTLFFRGIGETGSESSQAKADAAHALVVPWITAVMGESSTLITATVLGDVLARNELTGDGLAGYSVPQQVRAGQDLGDVLPLAAMLVVSWRTAFFGSAGRGRSFLPPTVEVANQADGTPTAAYILAIQTAADNFVNAAIPDLNVEYVVWNRPVKDAQGNVIKSGNLRDITRATISDKWATLRSRRD